jgi:hypothetical protein
VAVCRDGLERYPTYVSARVTLGRALLDLGDVRAALTELTHAVEQAPDNLAAARALATAQALAPELAPEAVAEPASESEPEPGVEAAQSSADASLMEWLAEPDDRNADHEVLDVSFASEWHGAPELHGPEPVPVAAALAATGPADAWAETIYAPVVPAEVDVAADGVGDASGRPDVDDGGAAVPTDEAGAVAAAEPDLEDWEGIALVGVVAGPPAESWGASVDAAVAEVFARAGGDVEPSADAPAPVHGGHASSLDTLQALLEAIRARRAALAASHSGVD